MTDNEATTRSLSYTVGLILAVAAAYSITGKLGLMLAIPPGYATAIFPASGVALAAVLLWGWRGAVGSWLGSFSINIFTSLASDQAITLTQLAIPSLIATGACLQAYVGATLIRRFIGFPTALDTERDIALFFGLGGPVSCVVSAAFGVTTLWAFGFISTHNFLSNWGNWWIGDALGVLVAAPVALTHFANPRLAWARRRISLTVAMIILLPIVVAVYIMACRWEVQRIDGDFTNAARQVTFSLLKTLDKQSEVLNSIVRFYDSSNFVDADEFHQFTAPIVLHDPSIQALEWVPRVTAATRMEFETEIRKSGFSEFQIWEQDHTGQLIHATNRDDYFPVTYIEPWDRNPVVHGYDLGSEPIRRAAIDQAIATGQATATERVKLVQKTSLSHDDSLLLFYPIYKKATISTSNPSGRVLYGFAVGVLNLGAIINEVMKPTDVAMLNLELKDTDAEGSKQLLYPRQPILHNSKFDYSYQHSLVFGGRHWQASFTPTTDYLEQQFTWQSWAVLVTGLLFTALFESYLLLVTGRWFRVESLVEERTRDLETANRSVLKHSKLLAASQDLLSEAQRIAHVGHWDLNTRTNDILWSDETYRIHGLTPASLKPTYTYFISTVHPDDRTRVHAEIQGTLTENKAYRTEYRLVRPDGEIRWVQGAGELHRDTENLPLRMVGVLLDVTERKRTETDLLNARIEADRANRAKSEFLSNMSHELRTPLNAILGYTQLMLYDNTITKKNHTQIENIQQAGEHLLNLINDVLDFSRIESGSMSVHLEDVELRSLLHEVRSLIRPAANLRRVSVSVDETSGTNVVVQADWTRLKQIILNLLSNAVKYNRADGKVDLRCTIDRDRLKILVQDTGEGISADKQKQLFQPFNRLGQERGEIEGTGIGLVITRQLIEMMGGTLGVQSTPGVGSTFWIDMPCAVRSEKLHEPTAAETLVKDLKACHLYRVVLYVEDNPANMNVVRSTVETFWPNTRLIEAVTGELGVAAALREAPDLILMDINLPGIDGYEALCRIRMSDSLVDVPVYALTANAVPAEIQRALAAGFTGYLTKPLDLPSFIRVVDECLADSPHTKTAVTQACPTCQRVLVADDDAFNVDVLRSMIEAMGYEVDMCSNGLEALNQVKKVNYGLVFMDCEMPIMTGYEATRAIRQLPTHVANIPILAVSAHQPGEDVDKREYAGFTGTMPKPINVNILRELLNQYLTPNETQKTDTVEKKLVLNQNALNQMHQLLGAKTLSIIHSFLSDVPTRLEHLHLAITTNDLETVQREAHTLKGSSSNLGAVGLAQLCSSIYETCKQGQTQNLLALFTQAVAEFESNVKQDLNKFIQKIEPQKEPSLESN